MGEKEFNELSMDELEQVSGGETSFVDRLCAGLNCQPKDVIKRKRRKIWRTKKNLTQSSSSRK